MRKIYLLFLVNLISCEQRKDTKQKNFGENEKLVQFQHIDGTYEYVYPDNTADLVENQYIVLRNDTGLYYGTSDEFDEARTEYLPGFFVVPMQELSARNNSVRFKLKITSADLFTEAVSLRFKSSADARNAGYKQWGIVPPFQVRVYRGAIRGDTLYFKAEIPEFDKRFIKRN